MNLEIDGRTALVTGASGGIGWSLVQAFVAEGCHVVALAHRNLDSLRRAVERAGLTDRVRCFAADITQPDDLGRVFDALEASGVQVSLLVANAGVWPNPDEPLHRASVERIRHIVDVNLMGTIWTVRAWMKHLASSDVRHDPAAVIIGSTAGSFGEAGHADYSIAKAGLRGLLLSGKNELVHVHPYARINMVEPGWTVTPMAQEALKIPGVIRGVVGTMPLQQIARARDIAATAVFLCSPASRHTTGQVITIAGGMEGRTLWQPEQIDERRVRDRAAPANPESER